MKLPRELLLDDLSNLYELHDMIIPCCEEMKKHIVGEWYDSTDWEGKPYRGKRFPEGLAVEFIMKNRNPDNPYVVLSGEGQMYQRINFCPFCGEKIE